jgi:hypothetical protein
MDFTRARSLVKFNLFLSPFYSLKFIIVAMVIKRFFISKKKKYFIFLSNVIGNKGLKKQ